jgi:pilus retraction protein PilT
MNKRFEELITTSIRNRFSDVHIVGGHPLTYRREGVIHFDRNNPRWSPAEVDAVVRDMLTDRQLHTLKKRWSVDLALSINQVRIRINVFYTTRGLSLAIRLLPETIPDLSGLNLHPSLGTIRDLRSGLILVCGSTGSGKSTTVAAILEEINRSRPVHIITIEDPIEYRFQSKKAFIEQREVGIHVPSFRQGLLDVLRENPDVIFVGELREPDTIRLTLNAAESGHLVFATLHATDVEDAVHRINNSATGDSQDVIRYQFASTISWLIVQQLVYMEKAGFRVPVLSILRNAPSVRSSIRDNKVAQLETILQTGRNEGMFTHELYEREFIATRSSFNHPYKNPRSESSKEPDFRSSLIDPLAVQDVVYMTTVEDDLQRSSAQQVREEGDQNYVVLDSAVDLKDLIAQFGEEEKEERG